MIYEVIAREQVLEWIVNKQNQPPAPIWELESPSETFVRLAQSPAGGLREIFSLRTDSGAIEIDFRRLPDFSNAQMFELSLAVATVMDERSFHRWEDLDEEEFGAPTPFRRAVSEEVWGFVDGVRQVGPGGRITLYGRQRRADIVVRHRLRAIGGYWRPPNLIQNVVDNLFDEETAFDVRLRGTFGYFEASRLERQQYLRPVFVFLLDRPNVKEGPRWRVSAVATATSVDDLPLAAGVETAHGGCC